MTFLIQNHFTLPRYILSVNKLGWRRMLPNSALSCFVCSTTWVSLEFQVHVSVQGTAASTKNKLPTLITSMETIGAKALEEFADSIKVRELFCRPLFIIAVVKGSGEQNSVCYSIEFIVHNGNICGAIQKWFYSKIKITLWKCFVLLSSFGMTLIRSTTCRRMEQSMSWPVMWACLNSLILIVLYWWMWSH